MRPLACLLLLLVPALHVHAADPLPGHSTHGEAFDEGPRQAAVLIPGCGNIHFHITTKNADSQKFFEQGVGQLHGFWYYEAERSFRQVVMLDPDCAMGYWGCAMANVNNEKRAVEFIGKAKALRTKASEHEQQWIDALANFYADVKRDKKTREMNFIKDMESVVHGDAEDIEAKAFLAWAIWHAKEDGVPMVSREAVDAILSQVFAKDPMHPAHHYRIHLWDDDKPERALASAATCGQTTPGIAHMWHMPGHTFTKTERLDDASWQQEAATRVDHAYMIRTQILPDQIFNYAHNSEWWIRTMNEQGRAHDAIAQAKNMIEIPRHPRWNAVDKGGKEDSATYGRTRLLETLMRYELWDDLLALENSPYLDTTKNSSMEAAKLRALGIACFFKDDKEGLHRQIEALKPFQSQGSNAQASNTAPATTKENDTNEDKPAAAAPTPPPSTTPARNNPQTKREGSTAAANNNRRKENVVASATKELQALETILNDDFDGGQKLLTEDKEIPKARLVRYELKLGNLEKAAEAARTLPRDAPGMALRLDALVRAGKSDEARKQFDKARSASALLDADLEMSHRMDEVAAQLGFAKTWRSPQAPRPDSGVRPSLDSLGPVHWHPWQASDFSLPNKDGQRVTLSQFHGKPVVVLFYLGHVCGHCMEQMKAFVNAAKDFDAAGIQVVAIGSEPVEDLAQTQTNAGEDGTHGFTFLSDSTYETFKKWRCYDDFENIGLHGAFLIDASGQVRWADVSYEPFKDPTFLLNESQRLLKFTPPAVATK